MNELQTQINQVDPNLAKLKEKITLYLASLHYFRDDDLKTTGYKFEAVKLINVTLDWITSRVEDWTIQIVDGVKMTDAFSPEFIKSLNAVNMDPHSDETTKA